MRSVAVSHDLGALTHEAEMLARKKEVEETREHEKRLTEDRHQEHREMVEAIQGLTRSAGYALCQLRRPPAAQALSGSP